jgi:hypothetical protein
MSINKSLKKMIKNHEKYRNELETRANPDIKKLYEALQASIIKSGVKDDFPHITIKYSLGSGNVPTKPIIYFYDERETQTATEGKYVAIVLPDLKEKINDCFVNITFTQGIQKLTDYYKNRGVSHSKTKAKADLSIDAKLIANDYESLFNIQHFELAHLNPSMGVKIAQKRYITAKEATDESIVTTLKVLLNALTTYCNYESEALEENDEDDFKLGKYKIRKGQSKFKKLLVRNRGGCMVTGIKTINALDASHIIPHALSTNYSLDNGLLLRKDIHKLYDDKLLGIDLKGVVHISSDICTDESEYHQYNGQKILGKISPQMAENLSEVFSLFQEMQPS